MSLLLFTLGLGTTGDIFVKTELEGARIFVDGQDTGQTTPALIEGLELGLHEVHVLTDDCQSGWVDVVVRPGAIKRAEPVLELAQGSLSVSSAPSGSQVWLDDMAIGLTPLPPTPVACGAHELKLTQSGYAASVQSLQVQWDSALELNVQLEQAMVGQISVKVSPLEAQVLLDGDVLGSGPMTMEEVELGAHLVSVQAPGYEPQEVQLEVQLGQTVQVELTLMPRAPFVQRAGLDRVRWGTFGLGSALGAGAVVAGVMGLQRYQLAQDNYQLYGQLTYQDQPESFYSEQVLGPRRLSQGLLVGSGLLALGATGTFVFMPLVDPANPGAVASASWSF